MPHDRGLASIALAIARQDARRPRLAEEAASAEQLQATRAAAEAERAVFRAEREAIRTGQAADVPRHERARRERELYIRERNHEAAERAEQLKLRRRALDRVLVDGLHALEARGIEALLLDGAPQAEPPPDELTRTNERPATDDVLKAQRGRGLSGLMALARHAVATPAMQSQQRARQSELAEWTDRERRRLEQLIAWEVAQEAAREDFLTKQLWRDREVEAFRQAITAEDADAVATAVAMTLERSVYPEGIVRSFDIGFDVQSGLLVVEIELPGLDIIPAETDFQYVQSSDRIVPVPMRPADRRSLHQSLLLAIALRTLREITAGIAGLPVASIGLNGRAPADPRLGRSGSICTVSVLTTPAAIAALDSARGAEPRALLRSLGAAMPRQSDETLAVEPLVRLPQAIGSALAEGVIADFGEQLAALVEGLGMVPLRDWPSPDGPGLLANDDHPVLGGKILYRGIEGEDRVGIAAVEALLADMAASGAGRGILVVTGEFDLAALDGAALKPVELIDRAGLTLLRRRLRPAAGG